MKPEGNNNYTGYQPYYLPLLTYAAPVQRLSPRTYDWYTDPKWRSALGCNIQYGKKGLGMAPNQSDPTKYQCTNFTIIHYMPIIVIKKVRDEIKQVLVGEILTKHCGLRKGCELSFPLY